MANKKIDTIKIIHNGGVEKDLPLDLPRDSELDIESITLTDTLTTKNLETETITAQNIDIDNVIGSGIVNSNTVGQLYGKSDDDSKVYVGQGTETVGTYKTTTLAKEETTSAIMSRTSITDQLPFSLYITSSEEPGDCKYKGFYYIEGYITPRVVTEYFPIFTGTMTASSEYDSRTGNTYPAVFDTLKGTNELRRLRWTYNGETQTKRSLDGTFTVSIEQEGRYQTIVTVTLVIDDETAEGDEDLQNFFLELYLKEITSFDIYNGSWYTIPLSGFTLSFSKRNTSTPWPLEPSVYLTKYEPMIVCGSSRGVDYTCGFFIPWDRQIITSTNYTTCLTGMLWLPDPDDVVPNPSNQSYCLVQPILPSTAIDIDTLKLNLKYED